MNEPATNSTWMNLPIDQPKRIEIDLHFTEAQFSKMTLGFIPKEMEDKWFIFYENEWLYFHRSWTGYGIYKTKIERDKDGYAIREFWAERNMEKYNNESDDLDVRTFSMLIKSFLLWDT